MPIKPKNDAPPTGPQTADGAPLLLQKMVAPYAAPLAASSDSLCRLPLLPKVSATLGTFA